MKTDNKSNILPPFSRVAARLRSPGTFIAPFSLWFESTLTTLFAKKIEHAA
jgi:hypothetical protein